MISAEHMKGVMAFVQAADAGSFTLAARRMGLSKSGVAKSVARLEERFGIRLFTRTTRSFSLTAEGELFYRNCLRAIAELENAEAVLTHSLNPSGRLRVDLPVVFGKRWVVPILLDIATRYPGLDLQVSLTDRIVDPIEEGIDLVVRIGSLPDSAVLAARHLGTQTSVVCASPAYLARHGQPETLDDLDRHECIAFGRGGQTIPWTFAGHNGSVVTKPVRGHISFNHSDAILEAALQGHGVAILSTWLIAEHLRSGQLQQLLPGTTTRGFPIHAVWPQTRLFPRKVRVVVDELVRRFLPTAPWESPPTASR
jgi:DNA-binding transcriptional LysR family regulator